MSPVTLNYHLITILRLLLCNFEFFYSTSKMSKILVVKINKNRKGASQRKNQHISSCQEISLDSTAVSNSYLTITI